MLQFNSIVIGCLIIQRLHTRLERHLEPLAIAANTTQATHCCLDTVLLTFGYLVMQYCAMVAPEDHVGCMAILNSLEKCWFVADQNVFIATVIVNPFYQTTPFAPHSHFINARIKSLLGSLYSRFFKAHPPNKFYTELHDFLMGSGHYSELKVTCARHIYSLNHEVCLLPI